MRFLPLHLAGWKHWKPPEVVCIGSCNCSKKTSCDGFAVSACHGSVAALRRELTPAGTASAPSPGRRRSLPPTRARERREERGRRRDLPAVASACVSRPSSAASAFGFLPLPLFVSVLLNAARRLERGVPPLDPFAYSSMNPFARALVAHARVMGLFSSRLTQSGPPVKIGHPMLQPVRPRRSSGRRSRGLRTQVNALDEGPRAPQPVVPCV